MFKSLTPLSVAAMLALTAPLSAQENGAAEPRRRADRR